MFKLDNSTINVERFLISRITRIMKESMLELMMPRLVEFNKDGSSSMSIKWTPKLRTELDQEDSRLENHSTSNPDCGCRESLLITATTMLTLLQSNQDRSRITDKFGYMMKYQRLSNLTMRWLTERTTREFLM
jgi:hypothetical protein